MSYCLVSVGGIMQQKVGVAGQQRYGRTSCGNPWLFGRGSDHGTRSGRQGHFRGSTYVSSARPEETRTRDARSKRNSGGNDAGGFSAISEFEAARTAQYLDGRYGNSQLWSG